MNERNARFLIIIPVLLGLFVILREVCWHKLNTGSLHPRPQSDKTPKQYGAPYEELTFQSDGRALKAFYVAPPEASPKTALLIYHGNNESIASWSPVQGLLYAHGIGSMVFDYSGFGHSDGAPTISNARADGIAAWNEFKQKLPLGTRACAYGLSLGTGVLLDDAAKLEPAPDCLVIYGAFTSALGAGVRMHQVPAWSVPFLPDALESLKKATYLPAPLLVIHGEADEKIPVQDGRAIADAARARFVVLPGFTHGQPVIKPDEAGWADTVAFVRSTVDSAPMQSIK